MDTQDGLSAHLRRFFTEDGWEYESAPDGGALRMSFAGQNGTWECLTGGDTVQAAGQEMGRFVFRSVFPVRAEAAARPWMMELVTRANHGLILGSFEFDLDSGETAFKTSALLPGDVPDLEVVRQLVYVNVLTMDRYYPALQAAQTHDKSPSEALATVEG